MAQEHINLGTPPSGVDGDTDRQAWTKAEANFNDLYAAFGGESPAEVVAQVNQNTSDIATMSPKVDANTAASGQNTADIAALKPQVAQNTTDVGTLKTQMAAVNPTGGFKNKLINGNFDWWQRGTSNAAHTSNAYLADRWSTAGQGSTIAASQVVAPAGSLPNNAYYWHRCTVASVAGANNYAILGQKIEPVDTGNGQKVTISGYAKADTAGKKISIALVQNFGAGGSATVNIGATQTITLGLYATSFSYTVDVPKLNGQTIGDGAYLALYIYMDAGSGLPQAGGIGQQSGVFDFAQLQLEINPVATPFEVRPYPAELALCQRYYEKSYNIGQPPGSLVTAGASTIVVSGVSSAANMGGLAVPFKAVKRTNPTVTYYSPATGAAGKGRDGTNNVDVGLSMTVSTAGFNWWGYMGAATTWVNLSIQWTADAEF